MFGIINFVTSILTLLAILLFFALSFGFTPHDMMTGNTIIFAMFFLLVVFVDFLKWPGFHSITKYRKKAWYIFFALYVIFLGYLAFFVPFFFIIVAIYVIIFISMETFQNSY